MVGLKIGIDMGTTGVKAYIEGRGIVLSEPSVVAVESADGSLAAVGQNACDMVGRSPEVYRVYKPLEGGSVVNFEMAQLMLGTVFERICKNKVFRPTVAACMPVGITSLEQRTLIHLFMRAGAGRVCLIEEPLAAAVGAGVALDKPFGTMVVDIGGGTADVAVVTMGSIAVSKSVKIGGELLNKNIIDYLRINRGVIIGEKTAEELKRQLGAAVKRNEEIAAVSRGKSTGDGMPFYFEVTAQEIRFAIRESSEAVCKAVLSVLEITPPELLKDIAENGIIMTGGTSRLFGMDTLLSEYTSIRTTVVKDPQNAVVRGLGKALKNADYLTEQGYAFKTYDESELI